MFPLAYSGVTLYDAVIDCGVKQRRPAEKHCASVGGVALLESCSNSLTVGRGNGSAACLPLRPTAAATATTAATTTTKAKTFLTTPPLLVSPHRPRVDGDPTEE
jgi:hypothetical protein